MSRDIIDTLGTVTMVNRKYNTTSCHRPLRTRSTSHRGQAATRYGVSRQWVYTLLARYDAHGVDGLAPGSPAPRSSPGALPSALVEQIIVLRRELTTQGADAGPLTIAWHLEHAGYRVPSDSTIRRVLHSAGLITPAPSKRPRSTYIHQKNGAPGHPQTQGKIERFHQTLKRWLTARPLPDTTTELQELLDQFRTWYNTARPHRAIARTTPAIAYAATPKATPNTETTPEWRTRTDVIDAWGKLSLRYAGALRHLGMGRAHIGEPVLMLIHDNHVITSNAITGEIIAEHTINYQRPHRRQ